MDNYLQYAYRSFHSRPYLYFAPQVYDILYSHRSVPTHLPVTAFHVHRAEEFYEMFIFWELNRNYTLQLSTITLLFLSSILQHAFTLTVTSNT
jgi:predicted transposase YdaD